MRARRLTSGFTQAGVCARRQFCTNLQVHHPPEHLCNPRLREAATTLAANKQKKYDMKQLIIGITIILISNLAFGQRQETVYLDKDNTTSNYYIILYPDQLPWSGYLFLVPSFGEKPEVVLLQTDIPKKAAQNGILTIIPVFKTGTLSFGVDSETQKSFEEIMNDVASSHKLEALKLFLGGFSIGGACVIKFAQSLNEKSFGTKPTAVFAIDPPLDFERFYNSTLREIRLSDNTTSNQEDLYMIGRIEELMNGNPSNALSNYHKISPYSFSDTTQSAIKKMLKTPLRIYSEPDINWWIKERGIDFSGMNILDCSSMINELNRLGNEKATLIVTENKGFRKFQNKKHPHSWSIVDEEDLIDWLLKQ